MKTINHVLRISSITCALALTATAVQAENNLLGTGAGVSLISGNFNTFIGQQAGEQSTTARFNTYVGHRAGQNNVTGFYNSYFGAYAGQNNTEGDTNIMVGYATGYDSSGSNNVFLGRSAGYNNPGSDNVFLGYYAGYYETGSNKLYIANTGTSSPLIYGEFDNQVLGFNASVGIGTQLPTSPLHIQRADGTAKTVVEETNATVAARTLFELKNNGNTKFSVNNTDAGVTWAFANGGNDFRLSRQGSGVVEFILTNTGNLTIQGNLTELSSREQKHNIIDMDSQTILNKVLALPIKEWSYKDSADNTRHIGPMAEDFHAAFGLGETATGIATLDTSGVALAAIQGLDKKLAVQDKKLAAQDKRLAEKDRMLAALKAEKDAEILALQAELAELKELVQHLATKDQWALLDQ